MMEFGLFDNLETIFDQMSELEVLPTGFGSKRDGLTLIFDKYNPIDLYIPDCVKEIKALAFENCWNIRSVRLPMPASGLDQEAFFGCYFLERVVVPKGRKEEYEEYFYRQPFYKGQFCVVEEGNEESGKIDPDIVEKLHYKLIISVTFENKTYDYASVYDVRLGDEVYVTGSMAGEKGRVTRIMGELQQNNSIFYKIVLLAKRGRPAIKADYTEKEQKKAREKILAAFRERKNNAATVFKRNIVFGLQDDKELFSLALRMDGGLIRFGGEKILQDRQLMILALENTTDDLFRTTDYFIEDREIVCLQLERRYESFRNLSEAFKADEDIRVKLIESGAPYEFVSQYIAEDEFSYRLVEAFVRQKGYNLEYFKRYYEDRELLKIAVLNSREFLFSSWLPAWVTKDPEICYYAIAKGNITMLPAVDESLRNSLIFIAAVLTVKPKADKFWDIELVSKAKELGKVSEQKYMEYWKNQV